MSDSIAQLIQTLDMARTTDEVEQIIDSIAEIGESAIPALLQYEKTLYRQPSGYKSVMRIYQLMGYPVNRSAIPSIVSQASRSNSPGWETAISILVSIGDVAIPEIHDTFHFYFKDLDGYSLEIEALCVLLKKIDSPTIDPLMPELLYLLERGTDENHVDECALWPIKKIGSPKANAAIQTLGRIISSKRVERIRKISIDALRDFDMSAVSCLIPVLEECLTDPSSAIRSSSQDVLNVLDRNSHKPDPD